MNKPKVASTKKNRVPKTNVEYNNLVERWGRELANEIMLKRVRDGHYDKPMKPRKKKGPDLLDAHWARVGGSFEHGKKR